MNEFYEKKVEDDTIDEILKKKIEEITTDKFNSIEQSKEDFQTKLNDQKRKHLKIKESYEKKLELISHHLDDIKHQNIELEKKSTEGPGNEKVIIGLRN